MNHMKPKYFTKAFLNNVSISDSLGIKSTRALIEGKLYLNTFKYDFMLPYANSCCNKLHVLLTGD